MRFQRAGAILLLVATFLSHSVDKTSAEIVDWKLNEVPGSVTLEHSTGIKTVHSIFLDKHISLMDASPSPGKGRFNFRPVRERLFVLMKEPTFYSYGKGKWIKGTVCRCVQPDYFMIHCAKWKPKNCYNLPR